MGKYVDPSIGVGKRTRAQSAKADSVRNQPKWKEESTSRSGLKKKHKVANLDPYNSYTKESDSDSEDECDVPASSFVPHGTSSDNLSGYAFMPIFLHASFVKY